MTPWFPQSGRQKGVYPAPCPLLQHINPILEWEIAPSLQILLNLEECCCFHSKAAKKRFSGFDFQIEVCKFCLNPVQTLGLEGIFLKAHVVQTSWELIFCFISELAAQTMTKRLLLFLITCSPSLLKNQCLEVWAVHWLSRRGQRLQARLCHLHPTSISIPAFQDPGWIPSLSLP